MAPSALVCHTVADPYGDHHVGCGGNGDRIARHNSLRDAIFSAAQSAALAPRREVSSLIPSSLSRPADVFTRPSRLGCNRHFRPCNRPPSKVRPSPKVMLFWLGKRGNWLSHADACQAVGVSFIPVVLETLGGMSASAVSTVSCLGRLLGQRMGIPPADSTRHLFQRCAISLWRGNAALWIRRLPTLAPSVDGVC